MQSFNPYVEVNTLIIKQLISALVPDLLAVMLFSTKTVLQIQLHAIIANCASYRRRRRLQVHSKEWLKMAVMINLMGLCYALIL